MIMEDYIMKYCEKCGNELLDEAILCPKCGCSVGKSQNDIQRDQQAKKQSQGAVLILAGIAVIVIFFLLVMAQL